MLPAQSENNKIYESYDRICSHNTDEPEYLIGKDDNTMIAMMRNGKFSTSAMGLSNSIRFATPIIIKADGNAEGFFSMLTESWDKFHAITFYGGNINAIYNPQLAVDRSNVGKNLKNDGVREIRMRPWSDYTRSIDFEISGEKVTLTISVLQTGEIYTESKGAYSLGELNSFIRFSFVNAQHFDEIEKYYNIVRKLIAILTSQNNISFETYLSQRNFENKYFKTGNCKIFDHYENYSMRKWYNVISIYTIFDCIPNLITAIANNETDSLIELLPEDNRRVGKISITNIQDLCTALEVAYQWDKRSREKDKLIEELKKDIKKLISKFVESHDEIDVNKETTISSAFQYLDYTLKQKILAMYNENRNIVDVIISERSLPKISETKVASFVKLRNNKAHSGKVEWGDSADIYAALFALEYVCLFKYIGLPDEIIKSALFQIF